MPQYAYKGMNSGGRPVKGVIERDSRTEAAAVLKNQGLIITELQEKQADKSRKTGQDSVIDENNITINDLLLKISWVKQSEVVLMLKQLAALIKAGVSVTVSLSVLEEQSRNRKMKFILASIRSDVEAGKPLSEAMEQFPRSFPLIVTSVLKTGEASGLLAKAMDEVIVYWEEKMVLKKKIISSMIYPMIILLGSIGAVIFMISFVFPKLVPFLEMMGSDLPWSTQFIINLGNNGSAVMQKTGIILGGLIITILCLNFWTPGKYFLDLIKFKIPLIGNILLYSTIIQFAKTFSLLINSGVSIIEALEATNETLTNTAANKLLDRMEDRVLQGENLSKPLLEKGNIFPPMVGNMVKVGEETGGVEQSLIMVVNIYQELLESKIERMTALIEPVLILLMAGLVGFMASALIGGILSGYGTGGM